MVADNYQDPKEIYLQPWCARCEETDGEQLWCEDDPWGCCEICGKPSVKYVLEREIENEAI